MSSAARSTATSGGELGRTLRELDRRFQPPRASGTLLEPQSAWVFA